MTHTHLFAWLEQSYEKLKIHRHPIVTLSYAQSMDGCISRYRDESTALSNKVSSEATQVIRSQHSAIMIGAATVLADNPRLTLRGIKGNDPRPVVLDCFLRTPADSRLLQSSQRPLLICSGDASEDKEKMLTEFGAEIHRLPSKDGYIDLKEALRTIGAMGLDSVMVEGGGEVLSSFIASHLWDRAAVTIVPRWLGGYAPEIAAGRNVLLDEVSWIPYESDVLCLGINTR